MTLIFSAVTAALCLASPAEMVACAAQDIAAVPATLRDRVRYLALDELPEAERADAFRVLSGHVNGLSRETDVTPLATVPRTGGALLRLNLSDYGWDAKVWEQLADQEPYYTVRVEAVKDWPGGVWAGDGKHYAKGTFRTSEAKVALAPWLADSPACLDALVAATRSRLPIVRGAWFFNQTAAQADRKPGYYDFLGVKDEKTFQALIGFDAKKARRKVELREAVAISGVTHQPRAIVRYDADEGGVYWYTLDFRKGVDRVNALRVLGNDIEQAYRDPAFEKDAASEQFGLLPNDFWATGLFNNKGVRQDSAPDFIATDKLSRSNDHRVHVNVSCLRCHENAGKQSIDGWARNVFKPPLSLQSPDYDRLRILRAQYTSRSLTPFIERDRGRYDAAVRSAAGVPAKEYQRLYGAFWERYEDATVDLAWAAADLCMEPARLKEAVLIGTKLGTADTVLAGIVAGQSVGIRQWEETYPLAQTLIRSLK